MTEKDSINSLTFPELKLTVKQILNLF